MTEGRKIGLWIAGVFVGLLVLLVGSSLLVPMFIDQQAIRAKLQDTLAASMEGTIDFERLDISFFPPRGELTNISISVPGKDVVGIAESATAYLKILPLFRGRVRVGTMEIRRPDFRVGVPEIEPDPEKEQPEGLSLENIAGGAYGALSQLQSMRRDIELFIEKGRVSLTRKGEPIIVIRDIEAQIELPPDELSLDIRSASDMWESFRVSAKIDRGMEGKGRIEVKELQAHLLADLLAPQSKLGIGDSQVNAGIRFEMKGYRNIEGDVEASAPKLTVRRGQSTAPLKVETLKGMVRFADREMQFTLSELEMSNPRMKLSGRVTLDQTEPNASMEFIGKEMDVDAIRGLSLSLAGELLSVKKAFGTALGGTIDQAVVASKGRTWRDLLEPMNMVIKAEVSQMQVQIPEYLSEDFARLPYPVEISRGRFTYEGDQISWQDLDGRMGKTKIAQASGRVDWGEPSRIEVVSDQAVVNLGEVHPWLSTMEGIPDELKEIKSLKGQVSLSQLRLQGPLKNPKEWTFQGKGRIEDLLVESPRIPGVLNVSKAGISGNPERIEVAEAQVSLSDADLNVSGAMEGYLKGGPQLNLNFQGTVGPVAKEWISGVLDLPPEIQMRAPLSFSKANLVWGKRKETAFKGDFTVANGPQVSLDFTQGPQEGEIRIGNLVINGSDGRASMSISLGEKVIDLKFQGDLSEATMRQVMEENPYLNGWIRGDFNARILKDSLGQSRVHGTIETGNLSYQGRMSSPIRVNRVSMKALGNNVQVDSAELAWRGTEVAVKGNVGLDAGGLLVDLTVASEGFTWEKITRIVEKERKREDVQKREDGSRDKKGGIIGAVPLHGTLHVKAAYFQYGELRWEPFAFDLNFKGKRVDVRITEGRLCGIPTDATVKISPKPMELEAEAKAKDKELSKTLSCFLDTRLASGRFDFTGDIAAWGASDDLIRNLHGQFTVNAGEGRIYRFGLLAKILSVVNITEIFKGRTPDLTGEGLGYRSASFTGKIENGKVELEEGYIDGRSMGLAFKGGIDLPAKNMDVTVLVTPLKTVDTILENIPILGSILGDNFIAVPVRVTGNISDPSVIPLSPSAVGSGLLGILERTLKLPGKLIQPLIPDKG